MIWLLLCSSGSLLAQELVRTLTLDLKKNKGVFQVVNKAGNSDFSGENSNSFLTPDGNLFHMKVSSSKLTFTLKDSNLQLIKEFSIDSDSPIEFKNSDIVRENGEYGKTRLLDKTSQFLRKTNNSNTGLSVCELNGHYLVTLGSVTDQPNYAVMIGGFTGALIAAVIWNPTFDSFNSYQNRKGVSVNCLIDRSGNHVPGPVKTLAFDKIRAFLQNLKNTAAQTIYKFGTDYYLAYQQVGQKINISFINLRTNA